MSTHKGTWKNAERSVARWHQPRSGKRTPLSGINSGITHADCHGVDGLFIEVKYRASFALWTLYRSTVKLAKGEGTIPVVAIKEKGKQGFIDMIHCDYLDQYVQQMAKNREIEIDGPSVRMFEQEMPLLYEGSPAQVKFVIDKLNHLSFHGDGSLRNEWWTTGGDNLASWVQVSSGFKISLYGHFNHAARVTLMITDEDVNKALGYYR